MTCNFYSISSTSTFTKHHQNYPQTSFKIQSHHFWISFPESPSCRLLPAMSHLISSQFYRNSRQDGFFISTFKIMANTLINYLYTSRLIAASMTRLSSRTANEHPLERTRKISNLFFVRYLMRSVYYYHIIPRYFRTFVSLLELATQFHTAADGLPPAPC